MRSIFQIAGLPLLLILIIFSSAVALTVSEPNDNLNSPTWWLSYAVQQADDIKVPDCKDDALGYLGRAQALAGDVDGAISSASAISQLNKRIYVYSYAAKTFYKQGNTSGYKKSIEHARLAALSDMRIETRIFMNSKVVRTYLDCNDVDGARSFTAALKNSSQELQANKKIAAYLACNNDIGNTDAILNSITSKGRKETTLVEIAETCVRKGKLSIAEQMAVRLEGSKYKDRVYDKLGVAFAKKGEIKKARSIAEIISDSMHKSSVIAAIAKYQITTGDIDTGKKTALEISYRDHKTSVYSLIAQKQADAGEIDSAVLTIKTMVKMIENIPMSADVSKFGKFDDSVKKGAVEMVYLRVAKNLAEKNDIKGYNKYISKAIASVKTINVIPVWKGMIFGTIIELQLETGDIEGAKKTAKEINDELTFSYSLYNIVNAQIKKDDFAGAMATYRKITHTTNKSFACTEIACAFVKKNEIAKAKQILSSLGDSSKEAAAYRETAKAFVEMGKTKELANWLSKISTPQARVYACIGAVDGMRKESK